jgi:hypothetical protein
MNRAKGRYYLSRLGKRGMHINQSTVMEALLSAAPITVGKYRWTITDAFDGRQSHPPFVFGHLSKSSDEGHLTIVDPAARAQREAVASNLLKASAPFVYLPTYSGLAYLNVWDHIPEGIFRRRLQAIVDQAHGSFFAECDIEPISDYKVFAQKLEGITKFTELSATVHPPNPLFGRLWESLDRYVKTRNAENVTIKETSDKPEGLQTNVAQLVETMLAQPDFEPETTPAIGDAAILMAADGYGHGRVVGEKDGEEVIIRTSDTQKHFTFLKDPPPRELAERAAKSLDGISSERGMKHRYD